MPRDSRDKELNPGDIVTVRFTVKEVFESDFANVTLESAIEKKRGGREVISINSTILEKVDDVVGRDATTESANNKTRRG